MNDTVKKALAEYQQQFVARDFDLRVEWVEAENAISRAEDRKKQFEHNRAKCLELEAEMIKLGMVPKKDFYPILAMDEPLENEN